MSTVNSSDQHATRNPVGFGQLFRGLLQDAGGLLRDEAALFRTEMRKDVERLKRAGLGLGVAVLVLHVALMLWCAVAIVALSSTAIGLLGAMAIVAATLTVLGAVAFAMGRRMLSPEELVPKQTLDTLREDRQWLSELKERGRHRTGDPSLKYAGTSTPVDSPSPTR